MRLQKSRRSRWQSFGVFYEDGEWVLEYMSRELHVDVPISTMDAPTRNQIARALRNARRACREATKW